MLSLTVKCTIESSPKHAFTQDIDHWDVNFKRNLLTASYGDLLIKAIRQLKKKTTQLIWHPKGKNKEAVLLIDGLIFWGGGIAEKNKRRRKKVHGFILVINLVAICI